MGKSRVLFVCIHNSGRSQMAEAWLNTLAGDRFEAESAGFEPGNLNPTVVQAMADGGVDISRNKTKSVFDLFKQGRRFHYVITVCDESNAEACPVFPGTVTGRIHWNFRDPSGFKGSLEERLEQTKTVRDQIKTKIQEFIGGVVPNAGR